MNSKLLKHMQIVSRANPIYKFIVVAFFFVGMISLLAQPSGGPYGPIAKTYELPKVSGTIYYVAPDGKTDASGTTLESPITIETAIERVKTGDAIVMRGGTYRTGELILNQGITIQPYKDEQPILKGTYVATDWTDLGNGLWTTPWTHLFPQKPQSWWRRNREGKKTPQHKFNNDMVFVNGKFLQSGGWEGEIDENSFYIDYDAKLVYIAVDPTDKLVEITAFNVGLLRTTGDVHGKISDKIGPTVRGITFTQYAYRAIEIEGKDPEGLSPESEHGKDVIGSTFENCTITYCSRVAGYFRGDKMKFIHCKISDTSTEGLYILSSSDVLLEGNILTRNNIEEITGYYPAAVKIFNQCYRVTCKDNLIIDLPNSNGVWYDVGNVDGVFINNWVQNVGHIDSKFDTEQPWPSDNGFFFEISKGAIVAGNVFVNCDHGVWALNSCNVHFYNNTFINSTACIARNERSAQNDHFGWHPSTGPDVDERIGHVFVNNLMYGDENYDRLLLYVWQRNTICGVITNPQLQELDYNTYVRAPQINDNPIMLYSPVENENCQVTFNSLEGIQKLHPEFEADSKYFKNYNGPLFKGAELGNYEILKAFPGSGIATDLPAKISKLTGISGKHTGALPVVK
jgi:hypothetical protein